MSIAEAIRKRIRGRVISNDLLLDEHRTNFGRIFHWEPAAVVLPAGTQDVAEILRFAGEEGIRVSTRGAAHSQSQVAINEGGILIDMKSMGAIGPVAADRMTIEVEGGAIWRDVMLQAWERQVVPPVLTNNLSVTVGGTLSSAGVGVASFRYGTQADHVIEMEVVTGEGEVVRCSRKENPELYWAVLAGLGQCGIITNVRLELRRAKPMVRTYYLLYDDLDLFLDDSRKLIDAGSFDHMESWCSPSPQGFRTGPEGRRAFARWFFPLHLSIEFEPGKEPDEKELLKGLQFYEHLHTEDLPTPGFFRRLEPLFDLWKRGGTWEHAHPWMETILPMDRAAAYIRETIRDLPPQVIVGGHILLWVSSGTVSKVPLFMRPDSPQVVGFGILPAVPHRWFESLRPRLQMASELSMEYGGKRYLSGFVQFDTETWKRHYGKKWDDFRKLKQKFDPQGILNRGYLPLLEEETGTVSPPEGQGDAGESGPHDFGSTAWAHALAARINNDDEYRTAARGWGIGFNGDMMFHVEPDETLTKALRFVLHLRDGICNQVEIVGEDSSTKVGFVLRAPYPVWKQILTGKIRPMAALMTRKIHIEGSLRTLMKYTGAARALLRATASVPTRFPQ